MDIQTSEDLVNISKDGVVQTDAERQAKRRDKLRTAFAQCELLQTDIKTVSIMLKSAVEALKMIAIDNDEAKSIAIIIHQIDNALHVLNHDPAKQNKRKTDKNNCV